MAPTGSQAVTGWPMDHRLGDDGVVRQPVHHLEPLGGAVGFDDRRVVWVEAGLVDARSSSSSVRYSRAIAVPHLGHTIS